MSAITDAVAELCGSFGMNPARIDMEGHLALSIQGVGEVHFEDGGEELMVCLARNVEVDEDRLDVQRNALEAVHLHHVLPMPVQAAMHGDRLVFLARIDAHELNLPVLQRAIEVLGGLQDRARA